MGHGACTRAPNLAAARAAGGHLTTGAELSGGRTAGDLREGAGMDAQPRNSALCDFSSHRARSPHVCGFCFRMEQFLS